MDIELPSGAVITDVPEGTTRKEFLDKLAQRGGYDDDVSAMQREFSKLAAPGEAGGPIGESGLPIAAEQVGAEESLPRQITAGLGAAGQRIAAGLGGLVGIGPRKQDVETVGAYKRGAGLPALASDIAGSIALTAAVPLNVASKLPWAARAMQAAPRLFPVAGTAGTSALIAGATTPGNAQDRGEAALLAAGLAGALPAATGIAQTGRRMATRAGRQLSKAEALRQEIGPGETVNLIRSLREPYPGASLGVRPTAAMQTGHPVLQSLELGSRTRPGNLYAGIDEANAIARWEAMQRTAGEAGDLSAAREARDAITKSLRENALEQAGQVQGFEIPVARQAARLLTGEGRVDPNVKRMAEYVFKELEQGVTPQQLYRVRKVLTDSVPKGTELGASISAARRERMQLVESIDEALNAASGGTWGGYLRTYSAMSEPVTSRQAMQNIRSYFEKIPGEIPPGFGASPAPRQLAQQVLKQGRKEIGGKTFDRLSPTDRMFVEELMRDLTRQQLSMKARGIIGTDTAAKIASGNLAEGLGTTLVGQGLGRATGVPLAGAVLESVLRRGLTRAGDRALAELLQNPEALARSLENANQAARIFAATTQPARLARSYPLE